MDPKPRFESGFGTGLTGRRTLEKEEIVRIGDAIGPELDWIREWCTETVAGPMRSAEVTHERIGEVRDLLATAQRTLAAADSKLVDLAASLAPED